VRNRIVSPRSTFTLAWPCEYSATATSPSDGDLHRGPPMPSPARHFGGWESNLTA